MSEYDSESETPIDNTELALPGQRLKRTREELRLSRDEVAHHLHLDVQIVNALEDDDFENLPSPAYICGYLRSYARILKLPENDIVNAYRKDQDINATLIPNNIKILPERHINFAVVKYIVIIIAVLGIGAGMIWAVDNFKLLDKSTHNQTETIQLDTPNEDTLVERPAQIQQQIKLFDSQIELTGLSDVPKVEADSLTTEMPVDEAPTIVDSDSVDKDNTNLSSSNGDLKIVYLKDSWTEVVDAKGVRHIYRLVNKNSELYFNGTPPYTILLGNAGGVDVFYKNKIFNHKRFQKGRIAYFRLDGQVDEQTELE